jgi:hypothetical protein
VSQDNSCVKECAPGTFYPPLGIVSLGRLNKKCFNPTSFSWTNSHQVGYDTAVDLCNENPGCVGFYRTAFNGDCTSSLRPYGYWCTSDPTETNDVTSCNDVYVKLNTCSACEAGKSSAANAQECTNCPAYSTSSAGSLCTCNAGYTGPDGGACTACVAGKYKSASGSAPCLLCDTTGTSPVGSDSSSDCKCNAGYTGPDGGTCTACVAGKYKISTGAAACPNCPADTYQSLTGQTGCEACPADTNSPEGSDSASDCVALASSCTIDNAYPETGWFSIALRSDVGTDDVKEIWCPTESYIGFMWYGNTLYCLQASAGPAAMQEDSNAVTTFYDPNDCS